MNVELQKGRTYTTAIGGPIQRYHRGTVYQVNEVLGSKLLATGRFGLAKTPSVDHAGQARKQRATALVDALAASPEAMDKLQALLGVVLTDSKSSGGGTITTSDIAADRRSSVAKALDLPADPLATFDDGDAGAGEDQLDPLPAFGADQDYDAMSWPDLQKLAKERGIAATKKVDILAALKGEG